MTTTIQPLDFSADLLRAILWQYNDAINLQGILQKKQDWRNENQTAFWAGWIRDVFDLRTANEFGLRVWAIILDMPLFISSAPLATKPTWGFGPYRYNFRGGANFSSAAGFTSALPLEAKRLALQLRYFQLTTAGTIPEINRMLKFLFGRYGGAYVLDGLNMTMSYRFRFPLSWWMKFIFDQFDLLPRPAGVKITYSDGTRKYFGFGPYRVNFGHGNFGA